jgi:hypothetical protein
MATQAGAKALPSWGREGNAQGSLCPLSQLLPGHLCLIFSPYIQPRDGKAMQSPKRGLWPNWEAKVPSRAEIFSLWAEIH